MAGLVARELKAEFPHLPLIFHSHYQSGFAYATYLEALRCGANGVECSLGFPDGAGQPYSLSLLRMTEEYGLDTGNPDKAAWTRVSKLCRTELLPLYPNANVVRVPDVSVEQNGIAGGQRSILDKELRDAGQAELIPQVDKTVQVVRRQGGMVCQVSHKFEQSSSRSRLCSSVSSARKLFFAHPRFALFLLFSLFRR